MTRLLVAGTTLTQHLEPLRQSLWQQDCQLLTLAHPASGTHPAVRQAGLEWLGHLPSAVEQAPIDILMVEAPWLTAEQTSTGANPWMSGLLAVKSRPQLAQSAIILVGQAPETPEQLNECLSLGLDELVLPEEAATPEKLLQRLKLYLHQKQQLWQTQETNDQLVQINAELYDRNLTIEKELYTARQLQQSLLPLALPDDSVPQANRSQCFSRLHHQSDQVRVTGLYLPCDSLGGDLYDVIPFADGSLGVTMADVSGHGLPAGFITALYKSSFYRMTHAYQTPDEIMFNLNNELSDLVKTGDYITALYCRLMPGGVSLQLSGAGHPYPVFYRASTGTVSRLQENGPPLIWMSGMDYGLLTTETAPGDKMLLFTDGISEMCNPAEELFGEERLEAAFAQLAARDPATATMPILDELLQHLSEFAEGESLHDDLSMVLIEWQ